MKKLNFIFATIVAIALGSAIFISCQKEHEPTEKSSAMNPDQAKAQALMQKINDFASLRAAYQSGAKSDETMTLAEAREILDLTINFEHSDYYTPCYVTTLDTLHIAMPAVDKDGNVAVSEVISAYAEFEAGISNRALSIDDEMNVFCYYSIMFPELDAMDNEIEIVYTRGIPSPDPDSLVVDLGPFVEGDDWYWGKLLGPCDGHLTNERASDAAVELSKKFRFVPNPPDAHYLMLASEVRYYTFSANHLYNTEPCSVYWLFWEECEPDYEPCISYDEMNCYWRSINRNVVNEHGGYHYYLMTNIPYHQCELNWKQDTNNGIMIKSHELKVTYANVYYIEP